MTTWTKATTSCVFLAAVSVYPISALSAAPAKQATDAKGAQATEVRLLGEGAVAAAPAAEPPKTDNANAQVNVGDNGMVKVLNVSDASLAEVLRMLSMQSQKNIVASKEVRGTVTANLYNVTIKEALDAILKANGYGYIEKGNFIYVYSQKELDEIEKRERRTVSETFRLNYTPAAEAVNMLKPLLSQQGQVAFTSAAKAGIESSRTDAGGQNLAIEDVIVVRDYPDVMDQIRKVVKEVDRRPQQILVEATIVSARLTEDNALGIDFAVVGGVDFSGITDAGIDSMDDFLSGKVLGTGLQEKGVRGASTGFSQNVPDGGLRVGVATNNIAVFISALESITDTVVLANPKVLTLNKQKGEVLVGREDGYKTTTVTETTSTETVEFLQTGTRLIFRPFIGDDGYIRMEVHPEDSDGKVVLGLPTKITTEVTTNILVKDGHTIVIGGLFREGTIRGREQVPGLGNLPVVGPLFRSQADSTVREEIVILLTPHIVKDDSAYAAASAAELKEMEKLRAGVRRGLMPWGRERLAEGFYDLARKEMDKPAPDEHRAVWYLDAATNLNPKFLEAWNMKESLTGKQVATVDNSSIRYFMKQRVLAERGATRPQAAMPEPAKEISFTLPEPTPAAPAPVAPPATQPAQEAATPATPTTQPVAEAQDDWTYEDFESLLEESEAQAQAPSEDAAPAVSEVPAAQEAVPATQPVAGVPATQPAGEGAVIVSELPTEPADGK